MHTEALAFEFKLRQSVLCKQREEVAQFVHWKLRRFGTALWLVRRVPAPPSLAAMTTAAPAATFRLPRLLLLLFVARLSCCCAFLVIHLLFDSKRQDAFELPKLLFQYKAKSLNRPVGV